MNPVLELSSLPLYFVGDHHGSYTNLFDVIKRYNLENSYIIHVGDGGEGFITNKDKQLRQYKILNEFFESRNLFYKSIRGNHSDPYYFQRENKIQLSHFELLEDYQIATYKNKTIQFIGGAISIDRVHRSPNVSYWEGEEVNLRKDKCVKSDILVTHTAPSWCFPQQFNEIVYSWALEDAYLLEDLTNERRKMDEIFKMVEPSFHLYGHFHSSSTEIVNGCKHKLLNINEFYELVLE
jgi:hypothetical protein